jgi:molybdopterin-binding protein
MWFRKKEKIKRPFFRRIINYFIYFSVGVIILLLVAFGFTQTSSFRNWLKDTITEQVNSSTNGVLSIERIDGTIFSSLIFNNTLYKLEGDTLFAAEKIEIKTSPLKIIFKIIYFRKVEIENANIAFLKYEKGELNISRIVPPSEEPEDTVKSEFSWKLQVADLLLSNVNFKLQSYDKKYSSAYYPHPDTDDLRLDNLNIELSAFADMANHEYELYLREFNVKPNLIGFTLKNLSGNFVYFDDNAGVTGLNIETERSYISLSAAISEFPVFSGAELKLDSAPLRVDLAATDFNFDDLTTFIEGTKILKGNVTTHLSASGTLANLNLEKLEAAIGETKFELAGRLQNILAGGNMFINTKFANCSVTQDDINNLLPSIGIPLYKEYGVLNFDSLNYKGKPLNFNATFGLKTNLGQVASSLKMDLTGKEIIYDGKIISADLNLAPVVGITTNINCMGALNGADFSPSSLTTELNINAFNSSIGNEYFNEFKIDANGEEGKINAQIEFFSNETEGSLNTKFNFKDGESASYVFDIQLNGFNIQNFSQTGDFKTNLNINLMGDGENFDPDNLNLFTVIQIDSSELNGLSIDSTSIIIDIRSGENERVINLVSDLADVTVSGTFTVIDLVEAISLEAQLIASIINKKIEAIQPPKFFNNQLISTDLSTPNYEMETLVANRDFKINYLFEFKDFELLSLLLGDSEIDVDGELTGKFSVREDSISLGLETKINQFKFWNGSNLFYLSDFELNFIIEDKISQTSFEDFSADIDLYARRIFIGSEFRDLEFKLKMKQSLADLKLKILYEDFLTFSTRGNIDLTGSEVHVYLDDFFAKYNEFDLRNNNKIDFSFSNDEFLFNSFMLAHNTGIFDLKGNYSFTEQGDLNLSIQNMDGKDLSVNLFGLPPDKTPASELNLNLKYTGIANDPSISIDFALDSVHSNNVSLGFVKSDISYEDKLVTANINFLQNESATQNPWLGLKGTIPIDLSIDSKNRLPDDEQLDVNFFANNFDLRFAGGVIPGISDLNGFMEGDIKIFGTYKDINSSGDLQLKNGSLLFDANNLNYHFDAGVILNENDLTLSNFSLSNSPDTKGGGTINASGKVKLDNFEPYNIDLRASGNLTLLNRRSRAVNPNLYGNIAIRTREDIRFVLNQTQNYLSANLILKRGSNVTFSPSQSAFTNKSDKFNYVFVSTEEEIVDKEIDSLIVITESKSKDIQAVSKIPFDLDIKIQVENEAKMIFILSREFKQNLTAYLGGNFEYTVIDDVPRAKGELQLLDGSKLDFIKTFQADGSVKFLDEIDNPYLNVTSTYQSYYNPDTLTTGGNEYEVQIKIRLEGLAKSLNTNFIRDERNIEVYKRRTNFGQFELDAAKTASDAMFFIIVGKFPEDASLQETNLAVSTAASLAGSIVGGYLNEQLGDFVRSVNVQQVGTETKFSLIGKVGEVRYEIGGTSQVFQDLSRANIKIEYPFIFTRLILRLERREPTFQSTTSGEMINELGIKYSFTF